MLIFQAFGDVDELKIEGAAENRTRPLWLCRTDPPTEPTDVCVCVFCSSSASLQKEVYMIAAGVIGGVFLVCTVVMFLGVKERDGQRDTL